MKTKGVGKNNMASLARLTRNIKRTVERELWARAAGRCEFSGCNRVLYKSPITQEGVNLSEKAHIYSFSIGGPRGPGPLKKRKQLLNSLDNLLLVCHDCHRKIDREKDGGRYSVSLLRRWKFEHEKRIAVVTGVAPHKKSTVVLYGANIGDESSPLHPLQAHWAMFPRSYPSDENPICLGMTWEGKDNQSQYWITEEQNLRAGFDRLVRPRLIDSGHFSIFGLAPIPLLVRLGTLFTDKTAAQVYQLRREPEQTWRWGKRSPNTDYKINVPRTCDHQPALVISLSARIARQRVLWTLGEKVSIWELTIEEPHNDFLKSRIQLSRFREVARRLMLQIAAHHGHKTPLAIFPAMPIATAVELGRVRMPKADMPWTLYDQNNKTGAFTKALDIY